MKGKDNFDLKNILNGFSTAKSPTAHITLNKRGVSVGEKHLKLEPQGIPNIITQVQPKKQMTPTYYIPLANQRPFSLSPSRMQNDKLLPPKKGKAKNKKTLVLDLDETLVHSDFNPFPESDIILKVEFDGIIYNIYVLVRPGVQEFLEQMAKLFEIVVFTASLAKYAEPLLDILDKKKSIKYRLSRDHCTFINGVFVKELKRLNRDLKDLIILDNSPIAYAFNPENGLPIKSWYNDKTDTELAAVIPLLEFLSKADDVRRYIPHVVSKNNEILFKKANDMIAYSNSSLENDKFDLAQTRTDGMMIMMKKKAYNIGQAEKNKGENGSNNIKLVNPTTENQIQGFNSINSNGSGNGNNNNLMLNKGLKTTKNKNSFRFSSTKSDFYRANNNLVAINYTNNTSEKNTHYQNGDQPIKQACYLGNKKEQKTHHLQPQPQPQSKPQQQQSKTKLSQYTSLLERKDILLLDNGKLRPSSSARVLKETPNENQKTFFRSPTSINIPSLVDDSKKNPKNKTTGIISTKIEGLEKFQCFLPKTTTHHQKGKSNISQCSIKNCLECFFLKNNFSKSTRNSNTTQLGLYFKNKSKNKK